MTEHTCPKHPAPAIVCYVFDKCRCSGCKRVNAAVVRERARRKVYEATTPGITPKWSDGDRVRAHLRDLMEQGMGWKRIARAAGVNASTVGQILYGKYRDDPQHPEYRPPRKQVLTDIAERLLAVRLDLAPGALIDGHPTRLRLRALVACGWSMSRLAVRLGLTLSNARELFHGTTLVTRATADAARALYDELWNQPPTASNRSERAGITRARRYAAERGWQPPLMLDDDLLEAGLDAVAHVDHDSSRLDLSEVEWLLDSGEHPEQIARRLGRQHATLIASAHRHGRDDIAERLNTRKRDAA